MSPYELRYRDPDVRQPENIPTNAFIEGILSRKSIRRFNKRRKLPPGLLEYLIAAAQSAPNGSGAQSWSVIALTTPEEKEAFRSVAGEALDGTDPNNLASFQECAVFLIWVADNYKISEVTRMVAHGDEPESSQLLEEFRNHERYINSLDPDKKYKKLLFSPDKHNEWLNQSNYSIRSIIDATIAAQTFSLCAESLGLGTLYMGSIAHCSIDSYRDVLKLPDRTFPIFGMCVGYEHTKGTHYHGLVGDPEYMTWYFRESKVLDIKPRQPQSVVLHHGHYNKAVHTALKKYNRILIDYYNSVKYASDYFVTKCVKKIHSTSDQLRRMLTLGNIWK
jgi:nitroreductase